MSGSCKPLPFWCHWAAWPLGLLLSAQDFGQGYPCCYRRWAYQSGGIELDMTGSRTSSSLDRLMPVLAPTRRLEGIHSSSCQGCGVLQAGRQKRRHHSLQTPIVIPNFIAYRTQYTPDAAPWLPFMCWGQEQPRSLQRAGQSYPGWLRWGDEFP